METITTLIKQNSISDPENKYICEIKTNNLNNLKLYNDILQIIFGFLKWQKYYDICNFYNLSCNYDSYFREINPKVYPKIETVCNMKIEHLNIIKYLLNYFSTYQQTIYIKRYSNKHLWLTLSKAFNNACKNKYKSIIMQLLSFGVKP